ncbi:hypothetical protein [Clostridium amazonitimonense]|uniref:hypothetical protein n=1 Tax=Clostridium amazonitimonense TaxID=1499689 RepID=UPI0005099B10|nr:hypothetical protein [Clostridium amazonitimonense]
MKKKTVIVVAAVVLIGSAYIIFKNSSDKGSTGNNIVESEKDTNINKDIDKENGQSVQDSKDKSQGKSSNEEKDKDKNSAGNGKASNTIDIPEDPSKNFSYVEQITLNYKILFEGIASDVGTPLENIMAVVDKDSEFYLKVKEELEYYRKAAKEFNLKDFYLEDITYDKNSNLYEAHINESISFKIDGKESSKEKKGIYKIRLDKDNSAIVNYVEK